MTEKVFIYRMGAHWVVEGQETKAMYAVCDSLKEAKDSALALINEEVAHSVVVL
jgi:hypothetical protein